MRLHQWALAATLVLTGCSTMTNGTAQSVFFSTPAGIDDVSCQVKSEDHLYDIIAPTTQLLERQNKILYVSCHKPGYAEFITEIAPRIAAREYTRNIWNGVAAGLAVDTLSGASFSYPVQVDIELIPLQGKQERYITLYEGAKPEAKAQKMPADDMYKILQGDQKQSPKLDQAMTAETMQIAPSVNKTKIMPITDDYAPIALQPAERSVIVNSLEDALPE